MILVFGFWGSGCGLTRVFCWRKLCRSLILGMIRIPRLLIFQRMRDRWLETRVCILMCGGSALHYGLSIGLWDRKWFRCTSALGVGCSWLGKHNAFRWDLPPFGHLRIAPALTESPTSPRLRRAAFASINLLYCSTSNVSFTKGGMPAVA